MEMKNVIITGASSGIGKALVYEYFKRGYQITMAARNREAMEAIALDLDPKEK